MKPIHRKLWGIGYRSGANKPGEPFLIFESWDDRWLKMLPIPGTTMRPLMFASRQLARRWCMVKRKTWQGKTSGFAHWRVWPVRVTESVIPT